MERRSTARASLLAVAALVAATEGRAFAAAARARWRPSGDANVVGYRVYVRGARFAYGAPIDVGLPPSNPDGTLAAVIDDLNLGRTYHVAVTAYTAHGVESPLSKELTLGPSNPCVVDECDPSRSCRFGNVPNGTWCAIEGEQDPCAAIASCSAGQCVARANGVGRLESTHLRVVSRRGKGWLTVHARFPSATGFDPTTSGATLDVADESGAILYHAFVPGEEFRGFRQRTAFRYLAGRRDAADTNGVRAVDLFTSGHDVVTTIRAESVDLRDLFGSPTLRLALRFGDTCARDLALTCRTSQFGALTCR